MKKTISFFLIVVFLMFVCVLCAQDRSGKANTQNKNAVDDFSGFGFSTGIALTFYVGTEKPVEDAELIDGIVRITKENNPRIRIMNETHYFFVIDRDGKCGIGPFVGLLSSGEQFIDAFALGGMIGLRRLGEKSSRSLNFGFGWVWDRNVKVLGDGVIANHSLPPGEAEIRFKYKTLGGIFIITSFSF